MEIKLERNKIIIGNTIAKLILDDVEEVDGYIVDEKSFEILVERDGEIVVLWDLFSDGRIVEYITKTNWDWMLKDLIQGRIFVNKYPENQVHLIIPAIVKIAQEVK